MTTQNASGSEPVDARLWMVHFFDHEALTRRFMLFDSEAAFLAWVKRKYGESDKWSAEIFRMTLNNPDADEAADNVVRAQQQLALIPAEGNA